MMDPESESEIIVENNAPAEWSQWARRATIIVLLVGCLIVGLLLGTVLSQIVLALVLAFLLFYPIRAIIERTSVSYTLAVAIIFIAYLVFAIGVLIAVIPPLTNFLIQVGNNIIGVVDSVTDYFAEYNADATEPYHVFHFIFDPISQQMSNTQHVENIKQTADTLVHFITLGASKASIILGDLFLIHLLAVLFLLEVPQGFRAAENFITFPQRRELYILTYRIYNMVHRYFRGTVIVAGLLGLLTYIQLLLMGVPNGIFVGIVMGVFALIPIIGGIIGLIVLAVVPFIQGSSVFTGLEPIELVALVIVVNLAIQVVIWHIISPKVAGKNIQLPMFAVILGVVIGLALYGILGAFIVVPLIGGVRIIVIYLMNKAQSKDPYPNESIPRFLVVSERKLDH